MDTKYDLLSSLNKHFICNNCNKRFRLKISIAKHVSNCTGLEKTKCRWCHLVFKNRGNLVTHAIAVHGDLSYKSACNFKCQVCEKGFSQKFQLTYHIRRQHFNLQATIPYCNLKRINQVWFEKVNNSNNVMEIRKTGHNSLIMRRLDPNTSIKVSDIKSQVIDLTTIYPTAKRAREKAECPVCKKVFLKLTLKKHLDERHSDVKKHECNNCKKTFKRSYFFLRHVCHKEKNKRKGMKDIRIEKVQSLTSIKV